ncbi:hypothetical protein B484DRAFT_36905 [Ochromonadaceae sp. CCMP2298]|nr:hypothetical protein B484DRAFT_36905 [Ochromonadaceae sp. CCMP2298]
MANISPQSPSLNKGFWAKLEAWLRFLLTSGQFEEMIILTGPVYAPTLVAGRWVQLNHTIGTVPRLVHVPTHFFKVIVCKRGPGESPAPAAPVQGKSVYNLLMGGSKGAGAGKGSRGGEGLVVVGAFLVPNSDSVDSKAPLGDFVIRLEQLQSLVSYFPIIFPLFLMFSCSPASGLPVAPGPVGAEQRRRYDRDGDYRDGREDVQVPRLPGAR